MVVREERVGGWGPGLLEALSRIEDPRKPRGVGHPWPAILGWGSRCARCWEAPGACTPSPSGAGNIPRWPNRWDSAGSGPRARRRCITYFAGWTWLPSSRRSAAGPTSPWERQRRPPRPSGTASSPWPKSTDRELFGLLSGRLVGWEGQWWNHWPEDGGNGGPEWPWVIQTVGRQSAEDSR